MIVLKAERIDVECVIRGYLSGSAWAEYRKYGTISGKGLATGLLESDKLPQPLFTPTTKEDDGHDKPISIEQMADLIGDELTQEVMERSLSVYLFAEEYARGRGIIIADTKMEFGMINGRLHLIDELLTPDSSRFWDMEKYAAGGPQASFDKQPLRDWLTASGWNKEPPAPELPVEIVEQMAERYREAYRRLTGETIAD
jgi:phosphoribosylaminoimidazole-succinocarboxamide synthase